MIQAYIDGASRGNPGPSSIGVVLVRQGVEKKIGLYIGKNTNNFAEYTALIVALVEALKEREKELIVFSDSSLLVNQVQGKFKVKNPVLFSLHILCQHLIKGFDKFEITHITRDKNIIADRIANEALDRIGL